MIFMALFPQTANSVFDEAAPGSREENASKKSRSLIVSD
jgi:hypothetical protein